jgi:chemotaxis protein MotA
MDIATICGIIFGLAVIIGTIQYEGDLALFFNIPAIAIVVGGMTCSTMVHFSMKQFLGIFSVIKKTLFTKSISHEKIIIQMGELAVINRRDGALAFEKEIPKIKDHFLKKGLLLIIDNQPEENIRKNMELEIQYMQERHSIGKKILDFMGASCPSFAMVGTLIGLVSMLSKMSSPDQIGHGMACALVCTFYGAALANLIFLPLAGKLGLHSKAETVRMEMVMEGICGIVTGLNPSAIKEHLQVFLSSKQRENLNKSKNANG